MKRAQAALLLLLAALALLGGCREEVAAPTPAPLPQREVAASPSVADSPFGPDRLLRPQEEQLADIPVPRGAEVVSGGDQAAFLTPPHAYMDLVRFYKKQLATTHEAEERPGGTRFVPKAKEGSEVYVLTPRRLGDKPLVTVFGPAQGKDLPKSLQANLPDAKPTAAAAAPSRPEVVDPTSGGSHYTRRVERDAQGRQIVVLQPAPDRAAGGSAGTGGGSGARAATSDRESAQKTTWTFRAERLKGQTARNF